MKVGELLQFNRSLLGSYADSAGELKLFLSSYIKQGVNFIDPDPSFFEIEKIKDLIGYHEKKSTNGLERSEDQINRTIMKKFLEANLVLPVSVPPEVELGAGIRNYIATPNFMQVSREIDRDGTDPSKLRLVNQAIYDISAYKLGKFDMKLQEFYRKLFDDTDIEINASEGKNVESALTDFFSRKTGEKYTNTLSRASGGTSGVLFTGMARVFPYFRGYQKVKVELETIKTVGVGYTLKMPSIKKIEATAVELPGKSQLLAQKKKKLKEKEIKAKSKTSAGYIRNGGIPVNPNILQQIRNDYSKTMYLKLFAILTKTHADLQERLIQYFKYAVQVVEMTKYETQNPIDSDAEDDADSDQEEED